MTAPHLFVPTTPLLRRGLSTPQVMRQLGYALLPPMAVALWLFGIGALLVPAAAVAGAVLAEWALAPRAFAQAQGSPGESLGDGSAVVTGLLLGLSLTPAIPLWMAFLGGVVGIALGKGIWGGLGQNLFNPALVGRAFLAVSFPAAMTTWVAPRPGLEQFWTLYPGTLAPPFLRPSVDGVTAATPLELFRSYQQPTPPLELILGNTAAGCLGEAGGGLIILSGLYLIARGGIDWRIPAGILLTVALLTGLLHGLDSGRFPGPVFALFSGGLLFGAVFLATDPVTSPITPKGIWLYGIGIGLLVVIIRAFGSLHEGVLFAILAMNAVSPLLSRYTQPRPFGRRAAAAGETDGAAEPRR